MGDYTNLTMHVRATAGAAVKAAREAFEEYSGVFTFLDQEGRDGDAYTLRMGANEVSCGSSDELAGDLLRLVPEVGDFAFVVFEDPAYEWLGKVNVHVPGRPDFASECDANGEPVVSSSQLVKAVTEATDLDALRVQVEKMTGESTRDAFTNYGTEARR